MQTKKFLILVDLLKKTDYNAKITEIESKIPSISGLATTAALPTVENEKTDVRNLVKKKEQQIITQKLMKLKKKLLIIIVINILLLQNLIGQKQKILLQD